MIARFRDDLGFQLTEALGAMRRGRGLVFATVGSVAISLFVLGTFITILDRSHQLLARLRNQYKLVVYMKEPVESDGVMKLKSRLDGDAAVAAYSHITKDQALRTVLEEMGEKAWLLETLETNPLPDAFEITLRPDASVGDFASRIRLEPTVDRLSTGEEWVETLQRFVSACRYLGLVLIVVLGGATLLIVANTIWLTVYARRDEIFIMKQVGATNWFIRVPFLIEGTLCGLAGGLVAALALGAGHQHFVANLATIAPLLAGVPDGAGPGRLSVQLLFLGALLGGMGSLLSLRRIDP